jgi:hypothetical protein
MWIVHPIPDLVGRRCESLVMQEYWYLGEKFKGVNVLFLKLEDGEWQRFFFDCGDFFWKEVDEPDKWQTTPEDEVHYPQTEIGQQHGLIGTAIQKIETVDAEERPELHIHFSNGVRLLLRDYWYYVSLDFEKIDPSHNPVG